MAAGVRPGALAAMRLDDGGAHSILRGVDVV